MKNLPARILLSVLAGMFIHMLPAAFVSAGPGTGVEDPSVAVSAPSAASGPNLQNASYWFEKGALYATYGNKAAAVYSFQKAIAADPDFAEAYFNMGVVYGEMEDYQNAINAIDRAIGAKPETGRYYYGRGWIYLRSGRTEYAMADIRTAADLGDPEAREYLEKIAHRSN